MKTNAFVNMKCFELYLHVKESGGESEHYDAMGVDFSFDSKYSSVA